MKKLYFDIEKCLACRTCEMVCCVGHSLNKDLFKDVQGKTLSPARIKVASAKIKAEKSFFNANNRKSNANLRESDNPDIRDHSRFLPAEALAQAGISENSRSKGVFQESSKNYPVACRHCIDPKCVDACMAAALKKDEKTGQVLHDKDKCVGCWMCVMACPYGAIRLNKKEKIPVRCDLCIDIGEPRCVKSCPVKAIVWQEETEVAKK